MHTGHRAVYTGQFFSFNTQLDSWAMTGQISLRWKLLVAFFISCGLGSFLAWGVLLTSLCSDPRVPVPGTRDIAYNCHGAIVFISHLESALRHWLIPVGGLFIVLGLLAAFGALIASGHVRIKLSIEVTDTSKQERGS